MADGFSVIEGWWKFFQLLLVIASGALLWDLGDRTSAFLTEKQQTLVYVVEGATLIVVVIQLIGIFAKMLTPKLLAILLAVIGNIFWNACAIIVLRAYFYSFPKGIEKGILGEIVTSVINQRIPELKEMKYKIHSVGILAVFNASFFFVEACGVSSWRKSVNVAQRGFVFETV